ncbi:AAA family ATPase [Hymenobacter radiodurans]|uniref:AAA family ATPase n=1 Tax=Hymenobacter radiodurans TaxID=2496028 RepID=UPI001058553F|nr:AAA family ATPase [Hymenobacter radiodurans]
MVKRPVAERTSYTLTELLSRPATEIPQLVEGLLPTQGMAMLAGASDTGKSSILRQLGLAIALGDSTFLGFKINAVHRRAICVSTEDGDGAVGPILKRQLAGQHIAPECSDRLRFEFDPEGLTTRLDQMLTEQPADLVVIDAFGDLYEGNLNASNEVRGFLNKYQALAVRHNCLILFMHHTGKRTEEREPSKNNLLGSQGLEAKMRVVFELRPDPIDPDLRHLCILKGNYLPREAKSQSYALHFDENLLFHNTGARAAFGDLIKGPAESEEEREMWEQALQMQLNGFPLSKITTQLSPIAQGLGMKPPSRSTVDRRLKVMQRTVSPSQTIGVETVKREMAAA